MTARPWVTCVGLFVALATLVLTAFPAGAQTAPAGAGEFEIVGIQHNPRGTISVSVRVPGAPAVTIEDPVLIVDQVPQSLIPQQTVTRQRAAIVLAIDTSGSMAGAPIVAARQAARDLIARLAPGDQVSLLGFATTPTTLQPLSTNRAALLASVDSLQAGGATALYGAIAQASEQLRNIPPGNDRVLVLLSDGADDGGVSKVTAEESLRLLAASGAKAYAIGFGQQTDRAYLQQVAERTGGAAWHFGDRQSDALLARFADIGGVLGATEVIHADVPVLATGDHTVSLRGRINGTSVSASQTLRVTNEGLLTPVVRQSATEDAPITVDLNSAIPSRDLALTARIDGVEVPIDTAAGVLSVDPWTSAPGSRTLQIAALAGDATAAEVSLPLEIPALAPRLDVRRRAGTTTARGRIQGDTSPVVAVFVEGREVARGSDGVLSITDADAFGSVTFRLLDSGGIAQAEETIQIAPPGSHASALPVVAMLAVVGVAVAFLLVRFRRGHRPEVETAPKVRPQLQRRHASPAPTAAPDESAVTVVSPLGAEQVFHINGRPLTIGASADCDIVIEGEGVRGVHGRLTPLPGGDLMLHSLRDPDPRPHTRGQEDEWMLLRQGEEIAIGPYVVRLLPQGAL